MLAPLAGTTDEPGAPVEEISESARGLWQTYLDAIPRIGVALVVIAIGWLAARGLRYVSHRLLCRSHPPSFARVMSKLAGWVLVGVATLIAIAVTFPSVKPVDLLAGLGFFSVAIGFAFQDILENTLSGVLLLFRQPFRSGDQIEVQDRTGTVEAITIRETRLKTFDGQLVVIPNRDVYKSVIRVQTHYDDRRMSFVVGVAYENDAEEACRVIVDAMASVDGVAAEPPPEALVVELGVSTVDIDARFWCAPSQHETRLLLDEVIRVVKRALDSAGIEMPADIIALQATPSFKAAVQGDGELTPAGSVRSEPGTTSSGGPDSGQGSGR